MNECGFGDYLEMCKSNNSTLCLITEVRLQTVIAASKKSGDRLHLSLDSGNQYLGHLNCLSTYTSSHHIKRYNAKRFSDGKYNHTRNKVTRRSLPPNFDFKLPCFCCGKYCSLERDPRNANRWKRATICRTSDRGTGNLSYKDVVLKPVNSVATKKCKFE